MGFLRTEQSRGVSESLLRALGPAQRVWGADPAPGARLWEGLVPGTFQTLRAQGSGKWQPSAPMASYFTSVT